jgi:hypothetical protein
MPFAGFVVVGTVLRAAEGRLEHKQNAGGA